MSDNVTMKCESDEINDDDNPERDLRPDLLEI